MKFFSFTGALLGILSGWIAFGAAPEPGTPSAEVGPSTPFLENEPVLEGESPGYPVEPRTWYGRFRAQMLDRNAQRNFNKPRPVPVFRNPIQEVSDLPYGPHPCQRLDLYLPVQGPFPVLVYVHGGDWILEDKQLYAVMGRYLADHGVGAVLVNYRLPPAVVVEGELADVARAVGWVRGRIAEYGGDPCRLFLCGHSAGGHMVAVLATNRKYLALVGMDPTMLRGIISISGVYSLGFGVWPFGVGYVFEGMDKEAVSPAHQIHTCPPPFLLLSAAHEKHFMKKQARAFYRVLQEHGCEAEIFSVPDEIHYGQVLNIASPSAPQGPRILRFIQDHQ